MAFLAPKADIPSGFNDPTPYNIDGALPVVFGRQRVACKLIESPWHHVTVNHGDRRPTGHVYSLALAVCWGPVDRLFAIYVNGKPMIDTSPTGNWLAATRSGEQSTSLSFLSNARWQYGNGSVRIYWGTQGQPADSLLNGTPRGNPARQPPVDHEGNYRVHPPYPNICYLVFDLIHLDDDEGWGNIRGQTTIPTIEAEIFVAPPGDEHNGSESDRHHHGCNPIAISREILRNPLWGAGLPDTMLPSADWQTVAQQYRDQGMWGLLSPQWRDPAELGSMLGDWFQYYNGFLRVRDGVLLPGYIPPKTVASNPTVISRHDCLEEPDIDPQGWDEAFTEVEVTAKNVWQKLRDETVTARSPYVLRLVGEERRKTVDAPFVIHPGSASDFAARILRRVGQPRMKIAIKVLPGRAHHVDGSLIMPGDLVHLDYEPHRLDILCRVIEREDRRGEVRLALESEPGNYPEDYVEIDDPRVLPELESPQPVQHFRVVELPDALVNGSWPPQVAILAERPNSSVLGATVWISGTGDYSGEEQELEASLSSWAFRAVLVSDITLESEHASFMLPAGDTPLLSRSFTDAEQADGEMLSIVGDEFLSLGTFSRVGDVLTFGLRRAMWQTSRATAAAGSTAWIMRKRDLLRSAIQHELLNWSHPYDAVAARVWFRLRSYSAYAVDEQLSSVQYVQLRDRTPAAPADLQVAISGMDYIISWANPVLHYARTMVQVIQGSRAPIREIVGTTVTVRGERALTPATVRVRSVGPNGTQSAWTTYPLQVRNGVDANIATSAAQSFFDPGDGTAATSAPVIHTRMPTLDAILRMRVSIDGRAMFTDSGTFELVAYLATKRTGTTTWTVWDGNAGRPLAVVLRQELSFAVTREFLYESYFAHNTAALVLFGDPLIDWAVHVPASPSVGYAITVRMRAQMDAQLALPPAGPQLQ